MENYTNVGTAKTPTINFDLTTGIMQITGCSIPENPIEFYKPLIEALDVYSKIAKPTTVITIRLEYFNTGSSKWLLEVFKKLETIHNAGSATLINWEYVQEDEDMLEAGKDYKDIIGVPFNVVQVEG